MANRITTLFDLDAKGFDSGLKKLRTEVAKADGAVNKLKTAGSGLGTILQDNLANAAVAAGAALLAFGVKSVQAFQDTALAAGQFSDATGLAVDEASRLIEVAGDIGIEAGTVETALGKMNKTLGASPQLFTDLGVEIAKTNTGATDVNGTFLNVVDRLNAIEDPAERARVASQLLGKGWQGMAELIGQGSSALKASLAGVADAQVIDEDELAKARKFRDSMDELNDKLQAVMMTVGESLVPALSDAAETIGTVTDAFQAASGAAEDLTGTDLAGWATKLTKTFGMTGDAIDWFTEKLTGTDNVTGRAVAGVKALVGATDETTTAIEAGTDAAAAMAAMYAERVVPTVDTATTHVEDLEAATADLDDTYKAFLGSLDQQDAWDGFFEKMYVYHSETGRSAQETRDYTRDIAEMVMALENVPPETKAQMIATLDEGNIAAIESRLNQLARNRVVSIGGQLVGGGLRNEMEGRAMGGPVTAGTPYLVGERGPEVIVPGRSGTVIPNHRLGGGGVNVTINMPPGSNGHDVVAAIQQYEKRNGKSWRS
jgi:uncharacterized protein YutE (UPF0331/DUF86 family)